MARIRTIKPEFFTSEDIVALTPLARVLYIGLWCEADREGRIVWKPGTLQMRYLPREAAQFDATARELLERGLLVLYGAGAYCHIPKFLIHQRPNPREAKSVLPAPPPVDNSLVHADLSTTHVDSVDNSSRDNPQLHAANLDLHAQVGREGKGREKEGKEASTPNPVDNSNGNGAWWKTHEGIEAKGKELGLPANRGEDWPAYKSRLFEHINRQKAA